MRADRERGSAGASTGSSALTTSIEADAPVALCGQVVAKKGSPSSWPRPISTSSDPGHQEIIARNNFRPRGAIFRKNAQRFAPIKLFSVDQLLGGWPKVSKTHGFADGALYDQIMAGIKGR